MKVEKQEPKMLLSKKQSKRLYKYRFVHFINQASRYSIMATLKHPHIVTYRASFFDTNERNLYIVLVSIVNEIKYGSYDFIFN